MKFIQRYKKWFGTATPVNAVKASLVLATGVANKAITVTADNVGSEGNLFSVAMTATTGSAGTAQVETASVVGTIGAAGAGNATVIVTANGMTGSPKTKSVAVANNDTADQVAEKIRLALAADADIADESTGFFTVSGATNKVILTAKTNAANDATLNISIDNGTCTGLTAAPTSANTTAGVAPVGTNKAMTATLTGNDIVVDLGTDATGALDATKNTGTLIKNALVAINGVTATVNGNGTGVYSQAIAKASLTGGQYATKANSSTIIEIAGTLYIAKEPVERTATDGWKSISLA
jgi:hypothetical protein